MGHGGRGNAVAAHELTHALLFAVAHFLGGIDRNGSEAGAVFRRVGGEPDLRLEDIAVLTVALAFGGGAESVPGDIEAEGVAEDREVGADLAAAQELSFRHAEELLCRAVAGQDQALAIGGKDGGRAAFSEEP